VIEVSRLTSGLTIVTDRVEGARSVAIGAFVRVGARDEDVGEAGVSHLLEHAVFKGTSARTRRELDAAAERVGGELNATTSKEVTSFTTRLPAAHVALGIDLVGDLVSRPALRDDDSRDRRRGRCRARRDLRGASSR
jgi:predicted Zn-dependent peptidase